MPVSFQKRGGGREGRRVPSFGDKGGGAYHFYTLIWPYGSTSVYRSTVNSTINSILLIVHFVI